jgi:hypothetical protein
MGRGKRMKKVGDQVRYKRNNEYYAGKIIAIAKGSITDKFIYETNRGHGIYEEDLEK